MDIVEIPSAVGRLTGIGGVKAMWVTDGLIYVRLGTDTDQSILRVILSDVRAALGNDVAAEVRSAIQATAPAAHVAKMLEE